MEPFRHAYWDHLLNHTLIGLANKTRENDNVVLLPMKLFMHAIATISCP
jgi:hypothetical protein